MPQYTRNNFLFCEIRYPVYVSPDNILVTHEAGMHDHQEQEKTNIYKATLGAFVSDEHWAVTRLTPGT